MNKLFIYLHPRSLTASLPLKIDGWKTILSFWEDQFSGVNSLLNFEGVTTQGKKIERQLCHEKNPLTFHYTSWLIGILIMAYYNPHIIG